MFDHILVPLDGSPLSGAALDLAITLARDGVRAVTACHAVDTRAAIAPAAGLAYPFDSSPLIDALKYDGEATLAAARETASGVGVALRTHLMYGDPVTALTQMSRDCGADLVIMGTSGRSGLEHLFLGSTTEGVLRRCTVPVMTLRAPVAHAGRGWPFGCVLTAADDSDPADAALALALTMAEREAVRVVFCTVVQSAELLDKAAVYGYDPQPMLDELRASARDLVDGSVAVAREHGVSATAVVAEGQPVAEILAAAAAAKAQLIVVGSHGRRGLRRFFVGSVAEGIIRSSVLPVLVVRTPKESAVPVDDAPAVHALR